MYKITAHGPCGEKIEVIMSEQQLRETLTQNILNGVRASQEIEGEPLAPHPPSVKELAQRIPTSMLTT